jgi:hypothetical protein
MFSPWIVGINSLIEMSGNLDEWETRILNQWQESKNMPRKKKKKVRKSLELDWQLCQYGKQQFNF